MKLIELLSITDDNSTVKVFCNGNEIACYDGKNSIEEKLNDRTVEKIYAGNHFIGIDVTEN